MWFGVAPPSPARVSRKEVHPPVCSCAVHRLERDRRLEAQQTLQSPRRAAHQSTSGPLSSRQRGVRSDKTVATPRRQMQRPRETTGGGQRPRDHWRSRPATKTAGGKTRHLQPEHGDEQSGEGQTEAEELLQLMEGCQIGGTLTGGETVEQQRQQNQVQNFSKESEVRAAGSADARSLRPRTGALSSLLTENQADVGTLPDTRLLPSRSRRPSLRRVTQSPPAEVESFEGNNSFSGEWSTASVPFASLHPEHLVGHTSGVCALVAHDDRFIVSCSVDGSVKVWSLVTSECLHTIYGHRDVVSCVDLNLRWLVSGSHDQTLRLYDCSSSGFSLLSVLTGHSGHVTQVRLPPSLPSCIVSCADDYTLRLWNAELGQCIYELLAHHARVTCFDAQADHICSGAADGSVCFWDLSSQPENLPEQQLACARIYYAHKNTVQCIADMSGSRTSSSIPAARASSELCSVVVTGSNDGTIQLFSAKTFAHLGRLDNVGSPVYAAAALSNGRLLCSTKDGRLLLYGNLFRPAARKAPAVLQLATKWISSLQVCGDRVACSSEEVLYIVDTARMSMELVFETQHSFITCTRWIRTGALITAGQDNVIKLWPIA